MIALSIVMSRRNPFIGFLRVFLIGALALAGCTSGNSVEPGKGSAASTPSSHKQVGKASWYGPGLQGEKTANGETFDQKKMTAAHPSLPMGTKAEVTNLENGKKVEVRINDRGPSMGNRAIDLSRAAAKKLDMDEDGITKVKIEAKSNQKENSDNESSKTK